MATPRRICVVTGSRAEYGLLYWVLRELKDDPDVTLQIVATAAHLSPEFGLTYREIEADGFSIDERVEMLLSADTPTAIAKSLALGLIGLADAYARLRPEIVVLLGDRYEILAAAEAALLANIPIAHIAGGDTTEGAYDEAIRHSITKMAHLHFVTNDLAAQRVRQMGEDAAHIHNFGSPGVDYIKRLRRLTRRDLERDLDCSFRPRNVLVTYHPVTLEPGSSQRQFAALLDALDSFGDELGVFITMPNADAEGRALKSMVREFVASRPHARAYESLGQLRYLSLMGEVDAVVGNSSSGLYEAPSLGKPTVNIGARQRGRLIADSVINCGAEREEIAAAITRAFAADCSHVVNPYGDGHASQRIAAVLKSVPEPQALLKKRFHMAGSANA